jgi:pimeloyl-ACP methyl ester carboxylesterase
VNPIKQNLILLHGALGSQKTFESFIPELSKLYHVYCFDFRGHGIHSEDTKITCEILCDQLIEFIEKNHLKRTTIFGYSMGGYIALMCSLKRPDLLGKIITLATKFEWNPVIAAYEINQLNLINDLPPTHPFKKQLILFHKEENIFKSIECVASLMFDIGEKSYLNATNLPFIKSKVLLQLGELDKMVSLSETTTVLNQLIDAELMILPDTKHPFEKVNQFELINNIKKFMD